MIFYGGNLSSSFTELHHHDNTTAEAELVLICSRLMTSSEAGKNCLSKKFSSVFAGTMKLHNICKRHGFLDTSLKQTESTIFLYVIQWD